MCMEDVAINRALKTNIYFTAGTLVIPANASRMSVRIVADSADTALLESEQLVDQGGGFFVNMILGCSSRSNGLATPPDDIHLSKAGDILKGGLRLRSLAAVGVYAIETYLDASMPSLAEFQQGPNSPAAILAKNKVTS